MNKLRIPEKQIYDLWLSKKLPSKLRTLDDKEIEIIDPGIKNIDYAGPDFHNARIRIGNLVFNGDVEIDNFSSDWKAHGHHLNSRFNKTILHIVLKNNTNAIYSINSGGRHIPILEIGNYLDENIKQNLEKEYKSKDELFIPCVEVNQKVSTEKKIKFLRQLGLRRYKRKCLKVLDRLKEIIVLSELKISEPVVNHNFHKDIKERKFYSKEFADIKLWNQILYEEIFEALGYTKNKDSMSKLGKNLEYEFISNIDNNDFIIKAESILFHISGLIPDITKLKDEETIEYVRKLVFHWNNLKVNYKNAYLKLNDWHFYKLRPQNFPTVRIAAAARILNKIFHKNLFLQIVNNFSKIKDNKKLISFLVDSFITKSEGYWANHYNFSRKVRTETKYFLGLSRVDEILTNCIFPILSIYFEIFDKKIETQRLLEIFVNYRQKEGSNLIDNISSRLKIFDYRLKSVNYQGMIELFRNYCINSKCLECEIGKEAFT